MKFKILGKLFDLLPNSWYAIVAYLLVGGSTIFWEYTVIERCLMLIAAALFFSLDEAYGRN